MVPRLIVGRAMGYARAALVSIPGDRFADEGGERLPGSFAMRNLS
jgi:hypothetical protein